MPARPIVLLTVLALSTVMPVRADDHVAVTPGRAWDDAAIAGLPQGGDPQVVSVYRAYVLAIVRSRGAKDAEPPPAVDAFDPQALAVRAEALGVADFPRFLREFLAPTGAAGETFVDPSAAFLDVLGRLQVVDNAGKLVDALEELEEAGRSAMGEDAKEGRGGRLEPYLQAARGRLTDALGAYREGLDGLKDELGLSGRARVVPDRRALGPFRAVFDRAAAWAARPDRRPEELPGIVAQLPRLEPAYLAGLPWERSAEPAAIARAAEAVAIRNGVPGPIDEETARRIDRRVRRVVVVRADYRLAARRWLMALQAKDRAVEQIMGRLQGRYVPRVADLILLHAQVLQREDEIVALWCSYQAERLALARDLRIAPARDWSTFCALIQGQAATPRRP